MDLGCTIATWAGVFCSALCCAAGLNILRKVNEAVREGDIPTPIVIHNSASHENLCKSGSCQDLEELPGTTQWSDSGSESPGDFEWPKESQLSSSE